jgi:hypothetical protein
VGRIYAGKITEVAIYDVKARTSRECWYNKKSEDAQHIKKQLVAHRECIYFEWENKMNLLD